MSMIFTINIAEILNCLDILEVMGRNNDVMACTVLRVREERAGKARKKSKRMLTRFGIRCRSSGVKSNYPLPLPRLQTIALNPDALLQAPPSPARLFSQTDNIPVWGRGCPPSPSRRSCRRTPPRVQGLQFIEGNVALLPANQKQRPD